MRNNKEYVIQYLSNLYDKWLAEKKEDENVGRGVKGADGALSLYSIDELFNEIMWKI